MESDLDTGEPIPVRRKTRIRTPKVVPPEKILDLPEEVVPAREPEVLARMDFAMPVLAVAFVLFLFSQVLALRQTNSALTWRVENLDHQAVALQSVRNNAADLLKQRQGLVEETQRVSDSYNALLMELLQLAQTDKDARSVVEKFNIKNSAPANTPTAVQK
jgi:uncharacterized protein YoxC